MVALTQLTRVSTQRCYCRLLPLLSLSARPALPVHISFVSCCVCAWNPFLCPFRPLTHSPFFATPVPCTHTSHTWLPAPAAVMARSAPHTWLAQNHCFCMPSCWCHPAGFAKQNKHCPRTTHISGRKGCPRMLRWHGAGSKGTSLRHQTVDRASPNLTHTGTYSSSRYQHSASNQVAVMQAQGVSCRVMS